MSFLDSVKAATKVGLKKSYEENERKAAQEIENIKERISKAAASGENNVFIYSNGLIYEKSSLLTTVGQIIYNYFEREGFKIEVSDYWPRQNGIYKVSYCPSEYCLKISW